MPQDQLDAIKAGFKRLYQGWATGAGIGQMRSEWDAFLGTDPAPATTEDLRIDGIAARWVRAPGVAAAADCQRAVLYLHGGGWQIGSAASHHNAMAALSAAARSPVLYLDYRLAPEHKFPAPVDDALAGWRWLLAQGLPPSGLSLAGDSAGGGLAIALMVLLRDKSLPLPAACVCMSPWIDLEANGATMQSHAALDPVTAQATLRVMARSYLGRGGDPREPLASPLHANLSRLPPLLVQVGTHEVLLDDARQLAARAQAQGVRATQREWDGMVHVFQLFTGRLAEADAALREAGGFLLEHTSP